MDKRELIAALVKKTGVKLDEDDPAFLLVDLNLIVLESITTEAAKQLTDATRTFNEVTTRNVDDFVAVANEALSKFMQRTSELIAAADRVALSSLSNRKSETSTVAAPAPTASLVEREKKPPSTMTYWWLLPLIFVIGLAAGFGLSIVIGK